jgi:DNA-binding GntR family transcriptional regulator
MAKNTFDNRNLYERVYLHIKNKILNNELKPGSRVEYDSLIEELGVSRTPLRDALNMLDQEGLIEIRPRAGTFISTPKAKDIEEIYDIRKGLERQAVHLASSFISNADLLQLKQEVEEADIAMKKGDLQPFFRSDRNFHQTIIRHSRNQRLIEIMDRLEAQVKWFGIIMTINYDRPTQASDMHNRILTAMIDSNVEKAKELMEDHIDQVKNSILEDFS